MTKIAALVEDKDGQVVEIMLEPADVTKPHTVIPPVKLDPADVRSRTRWEAGEKLPRKYAGRLPDAVLAPVVPDPPVNPPSDDR